MNYNSYIPQSPKVSELGVGAWQLGDNTSWQGMTEKQALDIVHSALDEGINFFDTAPNYGNGSSELRLGKALKGVDRSKIVINTKFGHTVSGGDNYSADYIRESLEGSLKRLQTDYVDSLIFHNPPFEILDGNNNPHYEILERLVEEGKIKAYGASLDHPEEMTLFMNTTNGKVIEAFFNILHQSTAKAFDQALEKKVAIIAKIPLDSGWLSGKYSTESVFTDIRSRWTPKDIQTRAALVHKVEAILGNAYSLIQAALSFCLAYEAVSTIIPGNSTLTQLQNNIANIKKPLNKDLQKKLEIFYKNEVEQLNLPW